MPSWSEEELSKLRTSYCKAKRVSELLALFPGRSYAGIRQKALSMELRIRVYWTREEETIVLRHYEAISKKALLEMLPRRAWTAIERKASELRVKRDLRKSKTQIALVAELRRIRRQRGIQADKLAAKFGAYGSGLNNWESGRRTPTLKTLIAWSAALNLEIVLQPMGFQQNTARPLVADPVKARLMARDGRRVN